MRVSVPIPQYTYVYSSSCLLHKGVVCNRTRVRRRVSLARGRHLGSQPRAEIHFALVRNRVVATYDKAGPEERDLKEGRRIPVGGGTCEIKCGVSSVRAVKPNDVTVQPYVHVLSLERGILRTRNYTYVCVICGF